MKFKYIFALIILCIINSCSKDNTNNEEIDNASITLTNIQLSVSENPEDNFVIGELNATVENSSEIPTYSIISQSIPGAIIINDNNITVSNPTVFDFETNTEITGQILASIGDISDTADFIITITDIEEFETDDSKFITTWKTTTDNEDITIYTNFNTQPNYNYVVEWGDGTTSSEVTGNITHNYSEAGIYTVKISGDFPAIKNRDAENAAKIETIENWGNISWYSMSDAFSWCSNLILNATDTPDLSRVTDMGKMFRNATSFNGDIGNWDVSNVSYMWAMFDGASSFNQDLNNWDVSNVFNMKDMFMGATSFNGAIGNWDVSNLSGTDNMFNGATSFNQNLNNWNVGSVSSMAGMFAGASSFNGDISNWDVSNVTNMQFMFYEAASFNQDLNNWNLHKVTNTAFMFFYASSFNQDLNSWDVNSVTTMHSMFRGAAVFNGDIRNWNVSNVTIMHLMFNGSVVFNQDLSNWETYNVTGCADFSTNSSLTIENKPTLGECDF